MSNPLLLQTGRKYRVIQAFTDYDKTLHDVGESWIFVRTDFIPYHDGLTLHVFDSITKQELSYRFQWNHEEQASLIHHFKEFVEEEK